MIFNAANFVLSKLEHFYSIMRNYLCIICTMAAIVIGIWAMYMPPQGIIDSSVLWFTAQLLIFTASLLGIKLDLPFKDEFHKAIRGGSKEV